MTEPVTVDEAKEQIGLVDDTSRDALIGGYIAAARGWVETHTGHILVRREVTEDHPAFGRFFDLRWQPFDSDTVAIGYVDAAGEDQTVADTTINGSRIYPAFTGWWPTTRWGTGVRLTYTAGYALPADVPAQLKQAILLLVSHWFNTRETTSERAATEIPFGVTALCEQFRRPL